MPSRAPKGWWNKMEKEIKEGNPDYSEDRVRKTVGDIWANKLSDSKKQDLLDKYEKKGVRAVAFLTLDDAEPEFEVRAKADGKVFTLTGSSDTVKSQAMDAGLPEGIIMGSLLEVAEVGPLAVRMAKRITVTESELEPVLRVAATFPNLLSNDAKKWIQIEVQRVASNYGQAATPEQAQAYIDKAAEEVTRTLADSVSSGVQAVITENRDEIMETMTMGMEPIEEAVPAMPAPQQQLPPDVEQQAVPMGASVRMGKRVKAQLPMDTLENDKIQIVLENSDDMDGLSWVIVTAPWESVQDDQSIHGAMWENSDGLGYAVFPDEPNLVEALVSEGYDVDDSMYYPFEE